MVTVSRTNFCFEMNLGKVPRQSLIKQPEEYKKTLDQAGKYTSHSTQCRGTKHQVFSYSSIYIFFSYAVKHQFPCFILLYEGSPVSLLWPPLDLDTASVVYSIISIASVIPQLSRYTERISGRRPELEWEM